ncbi:UDP-glucuronosyl/UDP-glucosyltransferase, partial [Cynara cardunculus var. scolymus]
MADRIICNSTMELETGVFTLSPKMLPIGPLLATNCFSKQAGHFWNEDSTCLTRLDQQPVCSVIYVAFGSFTIFNQPQFEELALGLELTKWQYQHVYPNGYMDRIGNHGKLMSWASQQEVQRHPSVTWIMSHCGGTLPWKIWKTDLGLNKDENRGIVTQGEIKSNVEQLLSNNIVKENALNLQEKVANSVRAGKSSNRNLYNFIDW